MHCASHYLLVQLPTAARRGCTRSCSKKLEKVRATVRSNNRNTWTLGSTPFSPPLPRTPPHPVCSRTCQCPFRRECRTLPLYNNNNAVVNSAHTYIHTYILLQTSAYERSYLKGGATLFLTTLTRAETPVLSFRICSKEREHIEKHVYVCIL